jgi:hypothetical protein
MVQFKFRPFPSAKLGLIYRPFAAVTLKYGSNSVTDQFLVDAGADITLIPTRIGMALNLPAPKRGEIFPLGGIGGFLPTVHRKVAMEIGNYRLEARIAWAQSERPPLLLGRVDVFDFFKITFDQTARMTTFIRKKKS